MLLPCGDLLHRGSALRGSVGIPPQELQLDCLFSGKRRSVDVRRCQSGFDPFGHQETSLSDEGIDHLRLRNDPNNPALDEQVPSTPSRGDAYVGLAGLAGPLTTQPITATWTGSFSASRTSRARSATSITSTSARPQEGQAIRSRPVRSRSPRYSSNCLPAFASSTGSAVSENRIVSPMPSSSSVETPATDLMSPPGGGPGLGDTEVQRIIRRVCQEPVGLDHRGHMGVLHGDLDAVKAHVFEVADLLHCGRHQCRRCRSPVFRQQILIERTCVDSNADRQTGIARSSGNLLDVFLFSDVARVEAEARHASLDRGEGQPILKMDVRDDRNRRPGHDLRERGRGGHVVTGDANDVCTRARQGIHLGKRPIDVRRLCGRHRLHRYGGEAPDGYGPHLNLPGNSACKAHGIDNRRLRSSANWRSICRILSGCSPDGSSLCGPGPLPEPPSPHLSARPLTHSSRIGSTMSK